MTKPIKPTRRGFLTGALGSALSIASLPAARSQPRAVVIQRSPLAGFQFHAGQTLWHDLRVGDALTLIRESDNPHDDRAVRVDWRGRQLGYVPRHDNTAVAQMLDRNERLRATIRKLEHTDNPWHRIEFEIRLAV